MPPPKDTSSKRDATLVVGNQPKPSFKENKKNPVKDISKDVLPLPGFRDKPEDTELVKLIKERQIKPRGPKQPYELASGAVTPTASPIDAAVLAAAGIPQLVGRGLAGALSYLDAPLTVGSKVFPYATANNLLNAAGAAYSGEQIINPESELRTNPNPENVLMTGLGLAGLPYKAAGLSFADDLANVPTYLNKGANSLKQLEKNVIFNTLNSKPVVKLRSNIINKINEGAQKNSNLSVFDPKQIEYFKKTGLVEGKEGGIYSDDVLDKLYSNEVGKRNLRNYLTKRFFNNSKPYVPRFYSPNRNFNAVVEFPNESNSNIGNLSNFSFIDSNPVRAGKTALELENLAQNIPGKWNFDPGSLSGDSYPMWLKLINRQNQNQFAVSPNGFRSLNTLGKYTDLSKTIQNILQKRTPENVAKLIEIQNELANSVSNTWGIDKNNLLSQHKYEIPNLTLNKKYKYGGNIPMKLNKYNYGGNMYFPYGGASILNQSNLKTGEAQAKENTVLDKNKKIVDTKPVISNNEVDKTMKTANISNPINISIPSFQSKPASTPTSNYNITNSIVGGAGSLEKSLNAFSKPTPDIQAPAPSEPVTTMDMSTAPPATTSSDQLGLGPELNADTSLSSTADGVPSASKGSKINAGQVIGAVQGGINSYNAINSAARLNQGNTTGIPKSQQIDANVNAVDTTVNSALNLMGPVGQAVSALRGVGDMIGKPIKEAAEARNPDGTLKDPERAKTSAIIGSFFDPIKALTTRLSYEGGLTDFTGDKYIEAIEGEKKTNYTDPNIVNRNLKLAPESNQAKYGGKMFSYGGNIYSNGGMTMYNMPKGLTHEQHPYGGYPIGNNNYVEGDEVVLDKPDGSKYIFSNRIKYKR